MLVFFIVIFAFSNSINIIDLNQKRRFEFNNAGTDEEYGGFIDVKIENEYWLNAVISQYLLGLGEFEVSELNSDDNSNYNVFNEYTTSVRNLLWFYFLFGTLLT